MPWYENRYGERLWYQDSGNGQPLLFLHGWCMSSEVWRDQSSQLSTDHRVIAPDFRGHGLSCAIVNDCTFDRLVTDIEDLLKTLELAQVVIVGWSMGAEIAIRLSIELTNLLDGLVLVAGTPCFSNKIGFDAGLPVIEIEGMRKKIERSPQRALAGFRNLLYSGSDRQQHVFDLKSELINSFGVPQQSVMLDFLSQLAVEDCRLLLPDVRTPVLILSGSEDKICPSQASRYMADAIFGSIYKEFSGSGHAFFMFHAELFNLEIATFTERFK